MNVAILSNRNCEGFEEDKIIANAIAKYNRDCIVNILSVSDIDIIGDYDLIIRRNTWEENLDEISLFRKNNILITQLIEKRNIPSINLKGLDWYGKMYLCDLFEKKYDVIPTIGNLNDINKIDSYDKFIVKEQKSYSSIGQKYIEREEIEAFINKGMIVQPVIDFKSEVQFYFIEDEIQYVLEYNPCKYPLYPTPVIYEPNDEEIELATKFSKITNCKTGVYRIDFLRKNDGKLILLEIEDNSPHLSLKYLNEELQKSFIDNYIKSIFNYYNKRI